MKNCRVVCFNPKGNKETGFLVALEENKEVPFLIRRAYYIYGTPDNVTRGYHAHKELEQLLICVSGSVTIDCRDEEGTCVEFRLMTPDKGLVVSKMVWHTMKDFSNNAVLLVLASDFYNENDYIRDYNEFILLSNR